jgi:hypothetical protein
MPGISRRQAQDRITSHEKIHVAFPRLIGNRGYYDPAGVCPEYEIKVKNAPLSNFAIGKLPFLGLLPVRIADAAMQF